LPKNRRTKNVQSGRKTDERVAVTLLQRAVESVLIDGYN